MIWHAESAVFLDWNIMAEGNDMENVREMTVRMMPESVQEVHHKIWRKSFLGGLLVARFLFAVAIDLRAAQEMDILGLIRGKIPI